MDQCGEDELNDIELAAKLSLLDTNEKRKVVADDIVEEDQELARAIEESLRSSQQQRRRSRRKSNRSHHQQSSHQFVCDVCDQSIPPKEICNSEFWNQYFCHHHVSDGTPVCCGCTRLKGASVEYIGLGDRRNICPDCFATSVTNASQKQSILDNVTEFLRLKDVELKGYIPVYLVDKREMSKHTRQGVSSGPVHPNTTVWGLTMFNPSEKYAVNVESLSRKGKDTVVGYNRYELNHSSGITILILFGLPKIMTGAIMAHELMHAWFKQIGVGNLEPKVEEGICQVMAHEWLDWFELTDEEASSGRSENAQFTRSLKRTFKELVEIDSSHAYGEGFREAKWAVENRTPHQVIDHIINYGTLPN